MISGVDDERYIFLDQPFDDLVRPTVPEFDIDDDNIGAKHPQPSGVAHDGQDELPIEFVAPTSGP